MKLIAIVFSLICLSNTTTTYAQEIEGVLIKDKVKLSDGSELNLNGAGVRTKFIFDIYVGALYLDHKIPLVEQIFSDTHSKRVLMHFLYDDLAKEKITNAWLDGFKDNNSEQDYKRLEKRLNKFNTMFADTKKGDEIYLDYIEKIGTQVWLNERLQGVIEGRDFYTALLKVWLGKQPADDDLKSAMLGQAEDD